MTDRKLALEAWESLFRAQHELFTEMAADFDTGDITQAEYDVLLTVTRSPEMTARLRDITANMLISQPSVSRLVDRMVTRGLVAKCADPDDGRLRGGGVAAERRVLGVRRRDEDGEGPGDQAQHERAPHAATPKYSASSIAATSCGSPDPTTRPLRITAA